MLDSIQQFKQQIESAKHVLICVANKENTDALTASLALKNFFESAGRQIEIVCTGYESNRQLRFIPKSENIKDQITHLQKLIIKVDLTHTKIENISYDIKDNWLSIYLNPKTGSITKQDLRTAQTSFKYDLIITIGAADLDSLGDIFLNNSDLFYSIPLINIDNQPSNEHYGQINFCDVTACANSEIVYEILKNLDKLKISEPVATTLLAGMIVNTKSFKTPNVTPKILTKASELMDLGADRDKVIKYFYHTKSIAALKLWGKALTHIKQNHELNLVWTTLTTTDFIEANATKEDLQGIIDELISNSPEAKMVLLLHEPDKIENTKNKIYGMFVTDKMYDAYQILKTLNPQGVRQKISFSLDNMRLVEAAEKVIKLIEAQKTN